MVRLIVYAAGFCLRMGLGALYAVMKLTPVRERVCFLSRQGNEPSDDFKLLLAELKRVSPQTETVTVCCRFAGRRDGLGRFAAATVRSMAYLASSKVCVLDTYWPAVSLLRHKKCLKVIQIWHANGKIKKSGYQTLDAVSGRRSDVARAMRMHRGYDYVIGGGPAWNRFYCESFGITEDKIRNYGLPRLDALSAPAPSREAFLRRYPRIRGKTVVLYGPTFRDYVIAPPTELAGLFDPEKYEFICRFHPRQRFTDESYKDLCHYDGEDIFYLLQMCDWFITDWSSLALEAAALNKPTLYYLPDNERYCRENGVNLDLMAAMPRCSFTDAGDLWRVIDTDSYPWEELARYRAEYLPEDLGHAAEKIVSLIKACLDGKEVCDHG